MRTIFDPLVSIFRQSHSTSERLPPRGADLGAEAEGALEVADLLERRTRMSLVPTAAGGDAGRSSRVAAACL